MIAISAHKPILVPAIVDAMICDEESKLIVDCTFGGGGHTAALLARLPREGRIIALDQDPEAIAKGEERFASEIESGRLTLVQSRFSKIDEVLDSLNVGEVDAILADIGFSSDQISNPEKGLSFQVDGPLDMRLDPSRPESAADLIARLNEKQLADLIWNLSEERQSRKIAAAIVASKKRRNPPTTTLELAKLIEEKLGPKYRRVTGIHPATRTFQALRMEVNQELEELQTLMSRAILRLKIGRRLAILSFHSIEDRLVKSFMRSNALVKPLWKKPVVPSREEVRENPRARSAKLRVGVKCSLGSLENEAVEISANLGDSGDDRSRRHHRFRKTFDR